MAQIKALSVVVLLGFAACNSKPPKPSVQVKDMAPTSDKAPAETDSLPSDSSDNKVLPVAFVPVTADSNEGGSGKSSVAEPKASGPPIVALRKGSADAGTTLQEAVSGSSPSAPTSSFTKEDILVLKGWLSSKDDYVITWDDTVHTSGIKDYKGSDLFHFYLTYWINRVNLYLKDKQVSLKQKKALAHLCKDSTCESGLDTSKIDSEAVRLILKQAGNNSPEIINPSEQASTDSGKIKSVLFLQGVLSRPGWGASQLRLIQQGVIKKDQLPWWQNIEAIKNVAVKNNVREVLVNLPLQFGPPLRIPSFMHYDVSVFIELGRFIRENKMDVRIVGQCGTHCANYLLPAAKTVYIEPYGYIYTQGSISGLLNSGVLTSPAQRDYHLQQLKEKWLPQLLQKSDMPVGESKNGNSPGTLAEGSEGVPASSMEESPYPLLLQYVTDEMLMAFGFTDIPGFADQLEERMNISLKELKEKIVEKITAWGQSVWESEEWEHFKTHIFEKYRRDINRAPRDWTKQDVKNFVRIMDNDNQRHFLEKLALMLESTDERLKIEGYLGGLAWLRGEYTLEYHQEMGVFLHSQLPYTYEKFLDLAAHLGRDVGYEVMFSVSKTYYAIPEEDKLLVMPSAGLLKKLGMDVRGENNQGVHATGMEPDKILYLDERIIKNCQFFESLDFHLKEALKGRQPPVAYTKETFRDCVSRSED